MLFYGPVDEFSYMLGNFFAQIKVFILALLAILIWINLCIWLLNLDFRVDIFFMLAASIFMCGQLVAFGLLLAAWGGKKRNALVYFILIIVLIVGIQAADLIVSTLVQFQNTTLTDPFVFLRNILSLLNTIIAWISPYSQLSNAYDAILNNSFWGFFRILTLMFGQIILMLGGSILLLKKKGVRGRLRAKQMIFSGDPKILKSCLLGSDVSGLGFKLGKRLSVKTIFSLILFFVLGLSSANSTVAQEELSFVYGTNHFNGAVYNSTFVPPTVDTFYLLSDDISMVASRFTQVYYWPLTNEVKPDWEEANIIVDGKLERLKNNSLIESIEMTKYVIQYDGLDKFGTQQLYLGENAVAARQNFEDLQKQYREDLFIYFQEMDIYREEFQAALVELQAGKISKDQMPEPPEQQQDLTLFSTNLLVGFPVDLPEGTYTVRLRLPDGSIQTDSQKKLVVFGSIREGIGYNVIADERWSAPEQSTDANEIIYSLPEKKIYLEAFHQIEYNELFYTRMNNPQDKQARRDRNIWVPFDQVQGARLQLNASNQSVELDMQNYFVRQLAGSALGYEIVVHDPASDREITFSGFSITVDQSVICFQLIDKNGKSIPYSERELRIIQTSNANWVYALSSLPLWIGLVAVLLRRSTVNTNKIYP